MIGLEEVRKLALSFEETVKLPPFNLISFRLRKKIFATLEVEKNRVRLNLSLIVQSLFVDHMAIYPDSKCLGSKRRDLF